MLIPISTRYPAPLCPGARIAITAPSSGVEPHVHARLDLVLQHLRDLGYVTEEGRCLRQQRHGASAPAQARAAELMRFLLRDDIAALFPPWGGELAIELLDRLDWAALSKAQPKWLMGYSDISTLMLPITLRLGWATAHGLNLMDLAPAQQDALSRKALTLLRSGAGATLSQAQSTHWQREWNDFTADPSVGFRLTERTEWRCLNREGEVHLRGRLIGGCLDTVAMLAGSPHGGVPGFIHRHADDGTLLYLENCEQPPTALVRLLHLLRWAGWLDGLAGVLIGRSAAAEIGHDTGGDTASDTGLRYEDALRSCLASLPCPVLADLDIGHRPPQFTLVNGALAQVRWSSSDGGRLTQQLV